MIDDYILISRIKGGDGDAWERLVHKYYDSIYFYCLRRCYGDKNLALDLTQDIFLKLVENIGNYRYRGKFFNYLYTIAVNHCHNYGSKKRFSQSELDDSQFSDSAMTAEDKLVADNEHQLVQVALDSLPEMQREAIILRYFHGLKVKDIAKITGVGESTAQSRIKQGLKKLAGQLDREAFGND